MWGRTRDLNSGQSERQTALQAKFIPILPRMSRDPPFLKELYLILKAHSSGDKNRALVHALPSILEAKRICLIETPDVQGFGLNLWLKYVHAVQML